MTDHTQDVIRAAAEEANPWWRSPGRFEDFVRDLPEACRRPFSALRDFCLAGPTRKGLLLGGLRRIGKTTIAKQVLRDLIQQQRVPPARVAYFNLQSHFFADVPLVRLLDVFESSSAGEGERVVVLDEIQFADRWDLQLRELIEERVSPSTRVFATGSSASLLHECAGGSLVTAQ